MVMEKSLKNILSSLWEPWKLIDNLYDSSNRIPDSWWLQPKGPVINYGEGGASQVLSL